MEAVLKLGFPDEKGIRCCACMLSFSKGEHYHCAAIGQRPICPEEGGRRRDCPLKERKSEKAKLLMYMNTSSCCELKQKQETAFVNRLRGKNLKQ